MHEKMSDHGVIVESKVGEFAERIRLERLRLGASQEEFGRWGGVGAKTQNEYENKPGKRPPDAKYLKNLSEHGVDVTFVVTGRTAGAGNAAPPKDRKKVPAGDALIELVAAMEETGTRDYLSKTQIQLLIGQICSGNLTGLELRTMLELLLRAGD